MQWLLTICDITVRYVSDVGKRIYEWHDFTDLNSKPERKESSCFER